MPDDQIPAPPSGSIMDAPTGGGSIPPPPSGTAVDPTQPPASAVAQPNAQQQLMDDEDQTAIGFAKGAGDTVHGIGGLIRKGIDVASKISPSRLGEMVGAIPEGSTDSLAAKAKEALVPKSGHDALGTMTTPEGTMQKIGYGGETLMEFMLGDEAIKGLSLADKMASVSKTMKFLEKSPRVMKALQMGADMGKLGSELSPEAKAALDAHPILGRLASAGMDALRAGTTQAAQTGTRTGDAGEALKQGAEVAGGSAVLGGALGVAGGTLAKGTKAGKIAEDMSALGKNAKSQSEITKIAQESVQTANDKMHSDYEGGMQKLQGWLGDQELDHAGSPLEDAAKKVLEVGKANEIPFAKELKATIPGSPEAKNLVQALAGKPEVDDLGNAIAKEPGAMDAAGNALSDTDKATDAAQKNTYTVKDLISMRQALGKRMRDASFDSPDKGIYRQLIQGVDDTVAKMANDSGNPQVVGHLDAMNSTYKQRVNLFKNKDVDALMKGNVNDVAARITRGETSMDDIDAIRKTIGKDSMDKLSDHIAQRWIGDATTESGRFDPAKFIKNWNKVKPEVRDTLFDTKSLDPNYKPITKADITNKARIEKRQQFFGQLLSDAHSLHNAQTAVKMGVATSVGGLLSGPVGAVLGAAALGEGVVSLKVGRELLDSLVNRPAVWKGVKGLEGLANSASKAVVPAVAATVQTGNQGNVKSAASDAASRAYAYRGAYGALSGRQ